MSIEQNAAANWVNNYYMGEWLTEPINIAVSAAKKGNVFFPLVELFRRVTSHYWFESAVEAVLIKALGYSFDQMPIENTFFKNR